MSDKILNQFNKLEEELNLLFSNLKKIDNNFLNYKPEANKWSIIQIIHHLYKSEQLSIVYIKRKVRDKNNIKKSNLVSKIRGFILEWTLRLPTKLKAPANVADVPDTAELKFYIDKWTKIRDDLLQIIKNTERNLLMSNIFKHPAVGETNIIYALKFMQAHFEHHKKQIDKILLSDNKFV